MTDVFIGLGSNVGDREANIDAAVAALGSNDMITIVARSSLIETKAVSKLPQPDYLNGVLHIRTWLTPFELLDLTQDIELKLGRVSKATGDPRTIDLDLLLFGSEIIAEDRLVLPHPLMHERQFVMDPLVEIAPDIIHPILGLSMRDLSHQVLGY